MKLIRISILALFLSLGVIATRYTPIVEKACAANWGGTSVCGSASYGAGYELCPRTGQAPDHCVTSSDFDITINGANIPQGQSFIVDIAPSDGSGDACYNTPGGDVTCLDRQTHYTTAGWTGAAQQYTFDRIGCSTNGTCTNNYTVSVRFAQPYVDPSLNCPNPGDYTTTIQNGVTNQHTFTINCQPPPITCGDNGTGTSPNQQCQQEGTATGCLQGWTRDTTGKTCTTPAVCCNRNACPVLAQPQPVVTCIGCTN